MIDWRSLFNEIRVPWIDRGRNTSAGNVNLCCPFCGDDPSFHLSVSESKEAYYCYRNPRQHSGTSLPRLLRALDVPRAEIDRLLADHSQPNAPAPKPRQIGDLERAWGRFLPAGDSPSCLAYIAARGFPEPVSVASRYQLAYAPEGRWAQRLLIPFWERESLLTWSGRAIRSNLFPKYEMPPGPEGAIYLPRPPRQRMMIVEGPIDALKIAVATEDMGIGVVAMAGLALNAARLNRIRKLAEYVETFELVTDATVPVSVWRNLLNELKTAVPQCQVKRRPMCEDYNDPGEMPLEAIRDWLCP